MKITTLCRLALLGAPALLIWPAATVWAAENPLVPATTPTSDFTLNDNGTAYHQKTGLTWKRCAEGQTWSSGACTGATLGYTWSQALQRGPANDGFAGFNDWRLPNHKELSSIVEQRNWNPAINATVFPNTPAIDFWSASPYVPSADGAWYVYFAHGNASAVNGGGSFLLAVRLVRGGQYALLSVTKAGGGGGAVSSNLPGVDCGNFCKGSFANEMYTAGQVVLTATPDANSTFASWTNCPSASGAECTVSSAGDRTVTATFMDNTTTTISSDTPDPSAVGQVVTVNYSVTAGAGTPTGTVTVSDGAASCTGTVAAGTCNLTFTSAGTKTLTATYAGDSNFNGSVSANENHTVNKANTTTTITSDTPDPSAVGQTVAVNFTVAAVTVTAANATIQVVNGGGPTGNVTVSDGTTGNTAPPRTIPCPTGTSCPPALLATPPLSPSPTAVWGMTISPPTVPSWTRAVPARPALETARRGFPRCPLGVCCCSRPCWGCWASGARAARSKEAVSKLAIDGGSRLAGDDPPKRPPAGS